jgi:hypothetical protein
MLSLMLGLVLLVPQIGTDDPFARAERALRQLADTHPGRLRLEDWGRSRGDRPLLCAALGKLAPGALPRTLDARPGILLVAGIDGRRSDDVTVALHHLQALCESSGNAAIEAVLDRFVLYVVPAANPDGLARGIAGNGGPADEDRDGREGEDPPDDLDGDGHVVMMRVSDPKGEWLADSADVRLLRKADPAKGERGLWRLLPEGKDDDGDGRHNEDAPGGVLLDRNFPHRYPEHGEGAGAHVLSEPEALGLCGLALGKTNLQLVVVYGEDDNLLADPQVDGAAAGKAPTGVQKDDLFVYAEIGRAYRELTGRKGQSRGEWPGRFVAWVYSQAGLPCLATSLVDVGAPAPPAKPGDE